MLFERLVHRAGQFGRADPSAWREALAGIASDLASRVELPVSRRLLAESAVRLNPEDPSGRRTGAQRRLAFDELFLSPSYSQPQQATAAVEEG